MTLLDDPLAAVPQVEPSLAEQLVRCSPQEQSLLAEMVRRAKEQDGDFDLVALALHSMKAEIDAALAADYRELSLLKAPPMVKVYPGAPVFPLPAEPLPVPIALDRAIAARASRRDFGGAPISLDELGTLLHYGYGVRKHIMAYNTREFPVRYTPNAGGLQSPEVYVIVNRVPDLPKGLFHYQAGTHSLELLNRGNLRRRVVSMSLFQEWMNHADVVLVLTTVLDRLLWKYGARSFRYAHMDIGYVSAHVYLVATALRLRTSAVSGFLDDPFNDFLELDGTREFTQLLMPIGRRAATSQGCDDHGGTDEPPA